MEILDGFKELNEWTKAVKAAHQPTIANVAQLSEVNIIKNEKGRERGLEKRGF